MRKKLILLPLSFQFLLLGTVHPLLANEPDDSEQCSKDIEKIVERKESITITSLETNGTSMTNAF